MVFGIYLRYYPHRIHEYLVMKPTIAPTAIGFARAVIASLTVLFLPQFLTGVFAYRNWDRKLIPPNYVQIVGILLVLVVGLSTRSIGIGGEWFAVVAGAVLIGWHLPLGIFLFGCAGFPDDILRCSFVANSNPQRIERILLIDRFREKLRLDVNIDRTENGVARLRTQRGPSYQVFIELEPWMNGQTVMNFAFAQVRGFEFILTHGLEEHRVLVTSYIEKILQSPQYAIDMTPLEPNRAEGVADYARHQLHGWLDKFSAYPPQVSFTVFVTIVLYVLSVGLFFLNYLDEGVATLTIALYFTITLLFRKSGGVA